MIEVEIKLPLPGASYEIVQEKLCSMHFSLLHKIRETDLYLDNKDGEIRSGGKALRIRRSEAIDAQGKLCGNPESVITYKGQKLNQVSMTRQELETGVDDSTVALQILAALGYRPAAPAVVKDRTYLSDGTITACLDHVERLGLYLELEILCHEDETTDEALAAIEGVLQQLGYRMEDTVRTSYLSMLMHVED